MSRRDFAKAAGCGSLGTVVAACSSSEPEATPAQLAAQPGFGNRFWPVYVDFKTQKRTPKLSAQWFGETARRHAVV